MLRGFIWSFPQSWVCPAMCPLCMPKVSRTGVNFDNCRNGLVKRIMATTFSLMADWGTYHVQQLHLAGAKIYIPGCWRNKIDLYLLNRNSQVLRLWEEKQSHWLKLLAKFPWWCMSGSFLCHSLVTGLLYLFVVRSMASLTWQSHSHWLHILWEDHVIRLLDPNFRRFTWVWFVHHQAEHGFINFLLSNSSAILILDALFLTEDKVFWILGQKSETTCSLFHKVNHVTVSRWPCKENPEVGNKYRQNKASLVVG